jgi:nucleotide-binding universal stress UspA family protein
MPTLVTIATYEQSKTAYFLKEKLENESIDCFFAVISTIEGKWDEVRVQVQEEDVEKAIRILLRIKDEYGMDIEQIEPSVSSGKIIVPIDFSKGSEYACHYAIFLAQIIDAEIKLLHVYEDPVPDLSIKESATYLSYRQSTLKEAEKKAKSDILDFTLKMKAFMATSKIEGVKIHASFEMGNTIGKIINLCSEYNPELIILGSTGSKDASKSVLAGLANSIISGLDIPVYIIPGPVNPDNFEKANILYATDFNEKDHLSLERLLKIMEPFHKKISCIHIDTAHNPAKSERMDELNLQLKKEYSQHDIKCYLIEDEDVYLGMRDYSERNQINLLSFTVHKRGIFEKLFKPNLFKRILQESNLPILLFPS